MFEEHDPTETVEAEEMVVGPFVYYVPSAWEFNGTNDDGQVDFYRHASGTELFVQRYTMTQNPGAEEITDPAQMLLGMNESVEERSAVVRLASGFTMVSYSVPDEDPDLVILFCELCRLYAPGKIAVIRFGCTLEREDLQNPVVLLWSHVIRQFARWTQFDPDEV